MSRMIRIALSALVLSIGGPLAAQEQDVVLPYWASIDTSEVYMRTGPGEQFPIMWVYTREDLPVRVVRLMQGWRYVEEPDGTKGWMSGRLLSRQRTAIVSGEGLAPMRSEGSAGGALRWNLEPGVVGLLGDCEAGWCEFEVGRHTGWVEQSRLWGAGEP